MERLRICQANPLSNAIRKSDLVRRFGCCDSEVREDVTECEWLARPNDARDSDLPIEVRAYNELSQALQDALTVREALFDWLKDVRCATVKVYRKHGQVNSELIISGTVNREDNPPPRVSSLVMRAKLYGLRFNLQYGTLQPLGSEAPDFNFCK